MTETDNLTDNLTDEERAEYENPVIEEADEDASPGDLSGGAPTRTAESTTIAVSSRTSRPSMNEPDGLIHGGGRALSRLAIVQRVRGIEAHEVGTPERPGDDVKYNTAYRSPLRIGGQW
jgi:hypothetical protein